MNIVAAVCTSRDSSLYIMRSGTLLVALSFAWTIVNCDIL